MTCKISRSREANASKVFDKYDLVAAEIGRVLGDRLKAIYLYDRAIATAQKNQYLQE
ncbi:hypothetical protein QUA80_20970 [Microcoleus sp. F4-D5]